MVDDKIVGTIKLSDIEQLRIDAKREGRMEVVDWLNLQLSHLIGFDSPSGAMKWYGFNNSEWQSKLKEWELGETQDTVN